MSEDRDAEKRKQRDRIEAIDDPDRLRRIAAKHHVAFAPNVTVSRMRKRLLEVLTHDDSGE